MKRLLLVFAMLALLLGACQTAPEEVASEAEDAYLVQEQEQEPQHTLELESDSEPAIAEELHPGYASLVTAQFKDGPYGTNIVTLSQGDSFLGLTLAYLNVYEHERFHEIRADFTGEVTLRGTIRLQDADGLRYIVEFFVADESLNLLPYSVWDSRVVWFVFDDNDGAIQMIGTDSLEFDAEIVIDSYEIWNAPIGVMNVASLVSVDTGMDGFAIFAINDIAHVEIKLDGQGNATVFLGRSWWGGEPIGTVRYLP